MSVNVVPAILFTNSVPTLLTSQRGARAAFQNICPGQIHHKE